jgi:hypothetical protein
MREAGQRTNLFKLRLTKNVKRARSNREAISSTLDAPPRQSPSSHADQLRSS